MKVKSVFLFLNRDVPTSQATVEVPGLGEVKIDHALSDETHARVIAESLAALRMKLGQTVVTTDEATGT